MNLEQARFNMVEQQIRTWEVLDQDVLDLLFSVRREDFVSPELRELAFADLELPIGKGQKMWPPRLEARVLQELALGVDDHVLEIGTGSGYLTALLASRAASVTSVELHPELSGVAERRLAGFANVRLALGDGARGWGDDTYDAIVLTGSTPVLPQRFLEQLRPGGRLFAIVGEPPVMSGRLVHRVAEGALETRDLFETVVDPLVNAAQASRFVF